MIDGGHLHLSVPDSTRFGYRIARGQVDETVAGEEVLADIEKLRADIAIFRCPAGCLRQVRSLVESGLPPIHADTLVYYRCDLPARLDTGLRGPAPDVPASVRRATLDDGVAIAGIVRSGFDGYRNHYHANPLLREQDIIEGYIEWARSYTRPQTGKCTWVVETERGVVGFATCGEYSGQREVEIVLNAVDPTHNGKGLYSLLLHSLLNHYACSGFDTLAISTQVWNYKVQRVWMRCGLLMSHAFDTYHVNSRHLCRGNT